MKQGIDLSLLKKRAAAGLAAFITSECGNYDRHYGLCVDGEICKVLAGRRCGYFERNVLIVNRDYKYRLPGCDYSKLFAQYSHQTNAGTNKIKTRRCGCGEPLGYRQRLCEKCLGLKRRDSYRKYRNSKKSQAPQLTAF